jgi:hypothetical protein
MKAAITTHPTAIIVGQFFWKYSIHTSLTIFIMRVSLVHRRAIVEGFALPKTYEAAPKSAEKFLSY